ncbi:MAG: prephenate dehydratase [Actinobacteria bacterium]|nr:prephenate dehydratase [Actinomycetota bacterium]
MSVCAYLGPAGSFSHHAARDLSPPGVELAAESAVEAVVSGIVDGRFESGVVPFESSQEGEVPVTLDVLETLDGAAVIAAERILPVTFNLFRIPGDTTDLRVVSSHPHALAQCSRELALRGVERIATASTSGACRDLAANPQPGHGAIAGPDAGAVHGLEAIATHVENERGALTRFIRLARSCEGPTIRDRTAFVIKPRMDQPGGLVRILQQFSLRSLNLTAITSRPARDRLGNYWFYLECEGHIVQAAMKDAVMSVLLDGGDIAFLGSFPEDPTRPALAPPPDSASAYRRYSGMRDTVVGHGSAA